MNNRTTQSASKNLRALILIVIAIALAHWVVSERFLQLFSPRILWQFVLAIVLLITLAWGSQPLRTGTAVNSHEWGKPICIIQIMLVGLPFCIATMITYSIELPKSVNLDSLMLQPAALNRNVVESEAAARDVLAWAEVIASTSDPHALDGNSADLIGIVFRDPRLAPNQIMIVRWRVSGSVINGQPVGIIAQVSDAGGLDDGTWIRLIGHFEAQSIQGKLTPILVASENYFVQPPEHPNIYP